MTLKGSYTFVVRDITDINHPFTVSTLGGPAPISGPNAAYEPKFVNASEISYYNDHGQVLRKAFDGVPNVAATFCNGLPGFAWSPDGQTLAYVTNTVDYSEGQFHLVTAGQDKVVANSRAFTPSGCESPVGCEMLDLRLLYSPDGQFVSLVNSWPGPPFQIWSSAGVLQTRFDSGLFTWSVWSGDTLYFRTNNGIETWRAGHTSTLLPGVAWVGSHASAGGGQIVYMVRDEARVGHIHLLDTATGKVRELATSRSWPAFLTSRYIWYVGERACVAADPYPCPDAKTVTTGKTYIYDLQTGAETESIIGQVWDVWPHPA